MRKIKQWKMAWFRPQVPDESQELRRRYFALLNVSDLNRLAFNRKMVEAGLAVMEAQSSAEESNVPSK